MSAPQQQPAAEPQQHPDWKQQLAERLDAYRSKRPDGPAPTLVSHTDGSSRASRIARAVASRYATAPSYSEVVEQAAIREHDAIEEARIAHARRMLEAAEAGQQALPLESDELSCGMAQSAAELEADGSRVLTETERTFEEVAAQTGIPVLPHFTRSSEMRMHQTAPEAEPSLEDLWASALVEPRAGLPSKLIEFPRELVSARRARPKDPEPPVAAPLPDPAQLRIFEVQTEGANSDAAQASSSAVAMPGAPLAEETGRSTPETVRPSSAVSSALPNPTDPARTRGLRAPVSGSAIRVQNSAGGSRGTSAESTDVLSSSMGAPSFKNLEWAAISLDREQSSSRKPESRVAECVPFLVDPASIDRRLMAFAVDFAAVTGAFLAFLLIFAASTPHLPTGATAGILATVVYAALWFLYQVLFFSLGGATAGMLYARIALCTFDDQNPTRPAMRRRLAAWWLSCLPVGLGFLWCFVDEDNLSWHDRMTRMYQREY